MSPTTVHYLWPEINKVMEQQIAMAKLGIGDSGKSWQLILDDGDMRMYRHEEEVDGIVIDPVKIVVNVKGVTAYELSHCYFNPQHRHVWESTLEHMTIVESISDDTILFFHTQKRIWPTKPRDILFWSHIRSFPNDQANDVWAVVNNSTQHPDFPANEGKYVRLHMTVCLMCETKIIQPKSGAPVNRGDISTAVTYCANFNPGGWVPAAFVRAVCRRECPKYLRHFTTFAKNHFANKQIHF